MLIELERPVADPSDPADGEDIHALVELCRFVASECQRLHLGVAERGALSLVAELKQRLAQHYH